MAFGQKLVLATVCAIAVMIAVVGGVFVLIGDSSLSFSEYVDALSKAVVGLGILGAAGHLKP